MIVFLLPLLHLQLWRWCWITDEPETYTLSSAADSGGSELDSCNSRKLLYLSKLYFLISTSGLLVEEKEVSRSEDKRRCSCYVGTQSHWHTRKATGWRARNQYAASHCFLDWAYSREPKETRAGRAGGGWVEVDRKKAVVRSSFQEDESIQLLGMTAPLLCSTYTPIISYHLYITFMNSLGQNWAEHDGTEASGGGVARYSTPHLVS